MKGAGRGTGVTERGQCGAARFRMRAWPRAAAALRPRLLRTSAALHLARHWSFIKSLRHGGGRRAAHRGSEAANRSTLCPLGRASRRALHSRTRHTALPGPACNQVSSASRLGAAPGPPPPAIWTPEHSLIAPRLSWEGGGCSRGAKRKDGRTALSGQSKPHPRGALPGRSNGKNACLLTSEPSRQGGTAQGGPHKLAWVRS